MPRRVRGVLVIENEETGDGRLVPRGAVTWVDPPLPLGWLKEEMHGDLLSGAVQVGVIETITRQGDEVRFTGSIDDENPDGAEVIRRMEAGMAPLGERFGLSMDPDDWEVEIVATDVEEAEAEGAILLVASGRGDLPTLRAAAGDPDPAGEDGTVVLFEDSSGSVVERWTRLRARGATMCAIAAFAGAHLELDDEAAEEPAEPEQAGMEQEGDLAAQIVASFAAPVRPPSAWFAMPEPTPDMRGMVDVYGMPAEELLVEQPDGGLGVPLTITADGRVFGHAARWAQCHTGYPGRCVTAPESPSAYAHYHLGEVLCADGSRVATGPLVAGCDHAAAELLAPEARDHYAHAGLAWADVRASNGALGVWTCGAVRPDVDERQLRVLRASTLSGDWRRIGNQLEFIANLTVNTAGFPIAREAVTASGLRQVATASVAPRVHTDSGVLTSLVASGLVHRCVECQKRASLAASGGEVLTELREFEPDPRIDTVLSLLRAVEMRTRPMRTDAAAALAARIRG